MALASINNIYKRAARPTPVLYRPPIDDVRNDRFTNIATNIIKASIAINNFVGVIKINPLYNPI